MNKIRILHIYNIMNMGGAENFIMNVYRNINREKYCFYFLCLSRDKGIFDKEIKELGGKILYFDNYNKKNFLKTILEFKKILIYNRIDVVHLPIHFYSGVFCISAHLAHIKRVIVHAHSASDNRNNIFNKIYRIIMRNIINKYATDKIACGKAAGKYLFGKNKKFEIMYNGINLKRALLVNEKQVKNIKEKLNINSNTIIIGHIGRFVSLKNHKFFIRLAEALKQKQVNFIFLLIGDGEERGNLEELISEKKLNSYFHFLGIQQDIPLYASTFNVMVMPSLYEGFPITIIESLACGIPCLLSDTITKEVSVIEDIVCFRNLNDNIELWCNDIIKLSRIKKNKTNCIKILEKKGFSVISIVKRLEKLYEI